ncbi:hypothetical protein CDAR_263631 [Caerostris darwini]|uniref:Uncharacterized protein n=1 Tax=Caerostris darwini TaxID=1538125 RepID=A0AAV4RVD3_9ARAC|nr:hypothetical protein CDAR_263631 [Caerostris darwini]
MFRYKTPNLASLFYDSGGIFFFKYPPHPHYYPHFPIPCCTNLPTTIAPLHEPASFLPLEQLLPFQIPHQVKNNLPPAGASSLFARSTKQKVNATVTWKTRVYWPVLLDMNCVRGFTAYLLTSLRNKNVSSNSPDDGYCHGSRQLLPELFIVRFSTQMRWYMRKSPSFLLKSVSGAKKEQASESLL